MLPTYQPRYGYKWEHVPARESDYHKLPPHVKLFRPKPVSRRQKCAEEETDLGIDPLKKVEETRARQALMEEKKKARRDNAEGGVKTDQFGRKIWEKKEKKKDPYAGLGLLEKVAQETMDKAWERGLVSKSDYVRNCGPEAANMLAGGKSKEAEQVKGYNRLEDYMLQVRPLERNLKFNDDFYYLRLAEADAKSTSRRVRVSSDDEDEDTNFAESPTSSAVVDRLAKRGGGSGKNLASTKQVNAFKDWEMEQILEKGKD